MALAEERALEVEKLPTNNFVDLVKTAGLDPSTDFRNSDLRNLDFSNCDLSGFDFSGSNLSGVRFDGSDVSRAVFDKEQQSLPELLQQTNEQGVSTECVQLDIVPGRPSKKVIEYIETSPFFNGTIVRRSAEGGLAPGKFVFKTGESRQSIVDKMFISQMENIKIAWENVASNDVLRSESDLLIMASIVELEALRSHDKIRIAEVFKNRLKRGMRLQSNATMIYGIYGSEIVYPIRLKRHQIMEKNQFNTYELDGLPAGPICNPSSESLIVSAIAEHSDYLFFCPNGFSGFYYAKTLEEHNSHVAQFRDNVRNKGGSASSILPER